MLISKELNLKRDHIFPLGAARELIELLLITGIIPRDSLTARFWERIIITPSHFERIQTPLKYTV